VKYRFFAGEHLVFDPAVATLQDMHRSYEHYQKVFDSFTDEHKERLGAYRSGDYYP